jgi:outer membrane protein
MAVTALALLVVGTAIQDARAQQDQAAEKLTLKEAVALAMKNSRELALARVQYQASLGAAHVSRSQFRPNLYTGSGLAYTYGFPSIPGGGAPAIFSLSYTEDIFDPAARGQVRAADARAESQRQEMEKMHDSVMVQTATAYLELGKVRHSLDLLREERTSAGEIADVTRERARSNLELPIEVTKDELTLAKVEQRIVQAEGRNDALEEQLRDLTGIPSDEPIEVESQDLPMAPEETIGETVNRALLASQDLKQAEDERKAQQEILKGNKGAYWPTFEAIGQYNVLSKFNNYDEFYKTFQRNNINVGVQIQIPLFSARTTALAAQSQSDLQAAELRLSTQRRETVIGAKQKSQGVREAEASKEVARLGMKLAQESLEIMQTKFQEGHATLRDLEQARLDENEKWMEFLDADFARQQAQLALLQATGQLAQVLE